MRTVELAAYHARISLKRSVEHALAVRTESDNLLVSCRLADGTIGWGEGVPRDYVTGETIAGAFEQLAATELAGQLGADCHSFADAVSMCSQFEPARTGDAARGCYGNSLRCAIELSALDAYGRHFDVALWHVPSLVPEARRLCQPASRVQYSGAITGGSPWRERRRALFFRLAGFRQCKVKVGLNGNDRARLARVRRILGRRVDLRVDANAAWPPEQAARRINDLAEFGITSVEQPVAHAYVKQLARVRRETTVPLMLDESLCSMSDARRALDEGTCDLFNIRLSKCGGMIPSLRLAALAHENGLGFQLGCQVGETGILSAAGRHFATSVAPIRYREGSFDRWLVRERLTVRDLTFGYGGWAPAIAGPGLGIEIDEGAVRRVTVRQEHWDLG
jgi:muconate cycloisomerase